MITIDEKLELFKEIVFNKVNKDNEARRNEFERKYGNLVEEKKQELTRQAEKLLRDHQREIEKEKTRLASKAKIEKKRMLRKMEKKIFDECIEGLLEYGKQFRETKEYEKTWQKDFHDVFPSIENDEIKVYCNRKDVHSMKLYVSEHLANKHVDIIADEEIIGGFILADVKAGSQFDLTIQGKIMASREKIGNMLMQSLT